MEKDKLINSIFSDITTKLKEKTVQIEKKPEHFSNLLTIYNFEKFIEMEDDEKLKQLITRYLRYLKCITDFKVFSGSSEDEKLLIAFNIKRPSVIEIYYFYDFIMSKIQVFKINSSGYMYSYFFENDIFDKLLVDGYSKDASIVVDEFYKKEWIHNERMIQLYGHEPEFVKYMLEKCRFGKYIRTICDISELGEFKIIGNNTKHSFKFDNIFISTKHLCSNTFDSYKINLKSDNYRSLYMKCARLFIIETQLDEKQNFVLVGRIMSGKPKNSMYIICTLMSDMLTRENIEEIIDAKPEKMDKLIDIIKNEMTLSRNNALNDGFRH